VILIGSIKDLDEIMELRGESDIRFDRVIGRNAFTRNDGWNEMLQQVAARMRSGGRITLAQVVPQHSQRLYRLCDWSSLPEPLLRKVAEAEEEIYKDQDDNLINWDGDALVSSFEEAGFTEVSVTIELQVEHRRITKDHLERWFGDDGSIDSNGKPTYAMRLVEAGLDDEELAQVGKTYRSQLLNQVVKWGSSIAYLSGKR
jgi:putative ATPase